VIGRIRGDARLHYLPFAEKPAGTRGRKRVYGEVAGPTFQMPANSRKTIRVNDQLQPSTGCLNEGARVSAHHSGEGYVLGPGLGKHATTP